MPDAYKIICTHVQRSQTYKFKNWMGGEKTVGKRECGVEEQFSFSALHLWEKSVGRLTSYTTAQLGQGPQVALCRWVLTLMFVHNVQVPSGLRSEAWTLSAGTLDRWFESRLWYERLCLAYVVLSCTGSGPETSFSHVDAVLRMS
jgi:hypothetical protein